MGYLDATGSLVRSQNEHQIFYFALIIPIRICLNDPTDPLPATDMLSASHTTGTLQSWQSSFRLCIYTIVMNFSFTVELVISTSVIIKFSVYLHIY